jgi:hypothetical protein
MYTFFTPYPSSYPLSPSPPTSQWCQPFPLGKMYPTLLFSNFVEEKREKRKCKTWHFSLFEIKVATQGVALWYFYVYMHFKPNWFISSNFLHSTLVPFLW